MILIEKIINKNRKSSVNTLKEVILGEIKKHVESRERLLTYLDGDGIIPNDAELKSLMFVEHCNGEHLLQGQVKTLFGETKEWHDYANKHKIYHDSINAMIEQHQAGNRMASRKLRKDRFLPAVKELVNAVGGLLDLTELNDDHKTTENSTTKSKYSGKELTIVFGGIITHHAEKRDILKRYTKGEAIETEELELLMSHESWPLNKWLIDEGRERYAGTQELIRFDKSHQIYHDLINDIIQKYDKNDLEGLQIADKRMPKVVNALKRDAMAFFFHIKKIEKQKKH